MPAFVSKSLLAALLLLSPLTARADEPPDPVPADAPFPSTFEVEGVDAIRSFSADATVQRDGSVQLVERIRVFVTGQGPILHGLERDLPKRRSQWFVLHRATPLGAVEVKRDGETTPFTQSEPEPGLARLRIGDGDTLVPPGEHTYELRYTLANLVDLQDGRDVFRWNVTGTGWAFDLAKVEAHVLLPEGAREVAGVAWLGVEGSTDSDVAIVSEGENDWKFSSNVAVPAGHGLTVQLRFAPGLVDHPEPASLLAAILEDNPDVKWLGTALLLAVLLQGLAWLFVGRDPSPGPIHPTSSPPPGLTAAAARFVKEMGFDHGVFTAAIVELAARGHLSITEGDDKAFSLEKSERDETGLPPPLKAVWSELFRTGGSVKVGREDRGRVVAARNALQRSLEQAHGSVAFKTNRGLFWLLALLSAVGFAGASLLAFGGSGAIVAFLTVWLTFWSVGVATLLTQVVSAWRAAPQVGFFGYFAALFITAFSVPFVGGELFALGAMGFTTSWLTPVTFALIAGVNVIGWKLLPRHTIEGRQLLDTIDGLEQFLVGRSGSPPPAQNDLLWPWAIALGVEKGWTDRLAAASGAVSGGSVARPGWLRVAGTGTGLYWASDLNRRFSSHVASTSTGSTSRSGSSSGFSSGSGVGSGGGGGGGGGGRGW